MRIGSVMYSKGVEASNYSELVTAIRDDLERHIRDCVDVPSWKPSGAGSTLNEGQHTLMVFWAMFHRFEKGLRGFQFEEETAREVMDGLQHIYTFWSTGRLQLLEEVEKILNEGKLLNTRLLARLEKLHQIPDSRREKLFKLACIQHEKRAKEAKTKRGYTWDIALEDVNKRDKIYEELEFDRIFSTLQQHFRTWRKRKGCDTVSQK